MYIEVLAAVGLLPLPKHINLRIYSYLTYSAVFHFLDRNDNEAVRDRIQCGQWIVPLLLTKHLSERKLSVAKNSITVLKVVSCEHYDI